MRFFVLSMLCVLTASCTSLAVQSPAEGGRLVLGAAASPCKTESSHGQWHLLFGAVPLNRVNLTYANPSQTYRVLEERSWLDSVITVVGGAVLTLTRKTVRVEVCEENFAVTSPAQADEQKKREIRTALDALLREGAPGSAEEPAFLMKSGDVRRGKIQEISEESIVILERRKSTAPQAPAPAADKSGKVARIMLLNGQLLVGEITNQSPTAITLATRTGTIVIQKANVRRVSYGETPAEKEAAKKKSEEDSFTQERITLNRSEIQRIVLAGDKP